MPFDEPALRLRDDAEAARVLERGLLEPDFAAPFEEVPPLLAALLLARDRLGDPFFEELVLACAMRSSLSSLTTCLCPEGIPAAKLAASGASRAADTCSATFRDPLGSSEK